MANMAGSGQKRTSLVLIDPPRLRRCFGDLFPRRCEGLQCDSRKAIFSAVNEAEAVSAECSLFVWNGIFMALFLGTRQVYINRLTRSQIFPLRGMVIQKTQNCPHATPNPEEINGTGATLCGETK